MRSQEGIQKNIKKMSELRWIFNVGDESLLQETTAFLTIMLDMMTIELMTYYAFSQSD